MKFLLSKILSWFKPKPTPPTLESIYKQVQGVCSQLDDIAFFFSQQKDVPAEITQQLENSLSRTQAFRDAMLIEIRRLNEEAAAATMNRRLNVKLKT